MAVESTLTLPADVATEVLTAAVEASVVETDRVRVRRTVEAVTPEIKIADRSEALVEMCTSPGTVGEGCGTILSDAEGVLRLVPLPHPQYPCGVVLGRPAVALADRLIDP